MAKKAPKKVAKQEVAKPRVENKAAMKQRLSATATTQVEAADKVVVFWEEGLIVNRVHYPDAVVNCSWEPVQGSTPECHLFTPQVFFEGGSGAPKWVTDLAEEVAYEVVAELWPERGIDTAILAQRGSRRRQAWSSLGRLVFAGRYGVPITGAFLVTMVINVENTPDAVILLGLAILVGFLAGVWESSLTRAWQAYGAEARLRAELGLEMPENHQDREVTR